MPGYICPHCQRPIYDDEAILCFYCGENLGRSSGLLGKLRYPKHKIIVIVIIMGILLSFTILIIK
jgi:predicted amidophosphoribosyltransferase